ncbi:ROK family protein [Chitinophaga sp. sic0106]|uniref:ROK family protein n=1 Tax=Chitinophaga sp. sic0106 TaxID=2854785 RepID=UPI001C460C7E|nr:ROK family protein [Chitinophaga sp. sic0106]MBV7533005.1 ROK family protein [Chitinophaga sp. sic0106]
MNNRKIGIDVGGSHVTAAVFSADNTPVRTIRKRISPGMPATDILHTITECIQPLLQPTVTSIGIAFPGPFDYQNGICAVNVGNKFNHLFGLHIKQILQDNTHTPITFANDAHCFANGIAHTYTGRTIALTLGTGFGSAFLDNGTLVTAHKDIPAIGAFYKEPFLEGTADDYFSTRWLLQQFELATGLPATSVREMTAAHPEAATTIFQQFGQNLGIFLQPWVQQYNCQQLVIGGNISKAGVLFLPALQPHITIPIHFCEDTEATILLGAAGLTSINNEKPVRKTTQPLLPVTTNTVGHEYNVFPSYHIEQPIHEGFQQLAQTLANEKTIIIDGFGGVMWEPFREKLHAAFTATGQQVRWYNVNVCTHSTAHIDHLISDYVYPDDPVFGKVYPGTLRDFFDPQQLELLHPDAFQGINIIYGTGAALSHIPGKLVYLDVPKNEIQYRMRAGNVTNIGTTEGTYKRLYFIDWPILNKHKAALLPAIDIIVDAQRPDTITFTTGDTLRTSLQTMLHTGFRARPWFEAGVWGGNWMKKHIPGLNQEEINYAWSFELISPENGIVLSGNNYLLEISFDFLAYHNNKLLLGHAADRFGTAFPIRFDFLDTYDGGNLSIQCHPRPAYTQLHFGESFTQDETYYILDCESDAVVYLGFQGDINPAVFRETLERAVQSGQQVNITEYVQEFKASKHDLFLIPNGTVHASGKNNLVLEISSTPYIFTFKMYDWQRLGLDGKPRPIHLERAFDNLYFDRKGEYVREKLISHQYMEASFPNGRKVKLPTHEEHFYTADRYEFTGTITIPCDDQCHICMLVEGSQISINANGTTQTFQYAETFVIPAGAKEYQCHYHGEGTAYLVVAYVKHEHC